MKCDLCGSDRFVTVHKKMHDTALGKPGMFSMMRCEACSLVAISPQISSDRLHEYYPSDYAPYKKRSAIVSVLKKLLWLPDRLLIKKIVSKGGTIFEIGPSRGDYLQYVGRGFETSGLEIDPVLSRYAKEVHNLSIAVGTVESYELQKQASFDLILMRFVLEHVRSPKQVLEKLHSFLKPGGFLLIRIPNFDSLERRIFGRFWHNYDVPRHFFIFNESTIRQYAKNTGFEVVSIKHSFFPNEWIGSVKRYLIESKKNNLAKFFSLSNPILLIFFLPASLFGYFFRKSSRITVLMRRQ